MSICQIAPYGGQPKWQKIGLKEYPDTKWLILIANKPDYTEINFLEEANKLKEEIETEQRDYPLKYKIKVSVLDITKISDDYYQLLGYIKQLFEYVLSLNYTIQINATSGLQLVRMILYQIALMYRDKIYSYFIYNRIKNKRQDIWLQYELNRNEQVIMEILKSTKEISLSELQNRFKEIMEKGSLSYIVKIIKGLVNTGLIEEKKRGRVKFVKLSEVGYTLVGIKSWDQDFKEDLK